MHVIYFNKLQIEGRILVIKKIIIFVVFFGIGLLSVDANTEKIYIGDKIPNVYIRKVSSTGKETVKQGGFLRRASDNQFVYCLEPFINLIDNYSYEAYISNYPELLNISAEVWEKITLIAYYGYQYKDHTADYWYYITQMLIWQEVDKNAEFHFTATLGGPNDDTIFASEIAELKNLVSNHYTLPEFEKLTIKSGETKSFTDQNGVLENFKVIDNSHVKIEGNELVVNASEVGLSKITLKKVSNNFPYNPIVYIDATSQDVMSAGFLEAIDYEVELEVTGASIKIIKKDDLSGEELKIAGIKFAIYDATTGELVFEGTTDSEGIIASDNILEKGKYKLVELSNQTIPGYNINEEEIYFEVIDEEEIVLEFFNNPITGSIKVIKFGENNILLEGVTFGLYDTAGKLIDILKTDASGEAIFDNIRPGKYKIKELATVGDYILDDKEYEVELVLVENKVAEVTIELTNYLPKGSLEIVKVNSDNETLADAEFILYNENKEVVTEVKTNLDGHVRIDNLNLGKYYLEEKVAPPGYKLLSDLIAFEIKENSELITINITNEEIEVDVPDTQIEFKIDKYVIFKKKKFVN